VRVLLDYRAALRERSGVGEYTYQLARSLLRTDAHGRRVDLTIFSSSRKDRLPADAAGYAAELYDTLHAVDDAGCDAVLVELPPDDAQWDGVRDRLTRAAHP